MSEHEFTIPVTDLDAGGRDYRFVVRPAWMRGALEDHEAKASDRDGVLAVRASKSGHDVVVHGSLEAELSVPCARCLEPFRLPIHAELSVLYVPTSKLKAEAGEGEHEFSAEEADTFPYDGEKVVLDDLVRDELILEVPMIPLCSEACPGMSPAPGTEAQSSSSSATAANADTASEEAGVDPRLAPLLRFRTNKSNP